MNDLGLTTNGVVFKWLAQEKVLASMHFSKQAQAQANKEYLVLKKTLLDNGTAPA